MKNIVTISALIALAIAGMAQDTVRTTYEMRTRVVKKVVFDTMEAKVVTNRDEMDLCGDVASVKSSEVFYSNGSVASRNTVVYAFDSKGYFTEAVEMLSNGETDVTTYTNTYYRNGKLQSVEVNAGCTDCKSYVYRYDMCGNVIGHDTVCANCKTSDYTMIYDRFHNPVYQKDNTGRKNAYEFTFSYKYDNACIGCILVKSVDRYNLTTKETYNYTTRYTYTAFDKVATATVTESNGTVSTIKYNYNEDEQLVSKEMHFADADITEVYTRDAMGSCTSKTTYTNGQMTAQRINEVTYNSAIASR